MQIWCIYFYIVDISLSCGIFSVYFDGFSTYIPVFLSFYLLLNFYSTFGVETVSLQFNNQKTRHTNVSSLGRCLFAATTIFSNFNFSIFPISNSIFNGGSNWFGGGYLIFTVIFANRWNREALVIWSQFLCFYNLRLPQKKKRRKKTLNFCANIQLQFLLKYWLLITCIVKVMIWYNIKSYKLALLEFVLCPWEVVKKHLSEHATY